MQHYRYYILYLNPRIRFLDFQKVKDAERAKATELFGTHDAPTELTQSITSTRSNKASKYSAAPTANGVSKGQRLKITEKEKKRFEALVRKAKTLADVQKLEKMYSEGRLPTDVGGEDAMDET